MSDIWPPDVPSLTPQEAVSAAKRIYRFGMGHAFRGKVAPTRGNRHTWIRSGVLYVNYENGWRQLVHDLSYLIGHRLHKNLSRRDPRQVFLERELAAEIVKRGWLKGTLRRQEPQKPPEPPVQLRRYMRVKAALERAEKRKKLAEDAVGRLSAKLRASERSLKKSHPALQSAWEQAQKDPSKVSAYHVLLRMYES